MFEVIGKDGKEYGPTTADEIRSWIRQGRLDAQSKIKPEGAADWKPLGELAEFREAFATAAPPAGGAPGPAKTSGLAVASLVLGALGFFTLGLTAIVGLILGIIALVKIKKSQGQLQGFAAAVVGIVLSALMVLLLPIMAAMLLPALAKAKTKAQTVQCMNHVKQLNLALMMYATDHNDTFPPADSWCDLIKPYAGNSAGVFHCAAQPGAQCSYRLNSDVANKRLSEVGAPATTVLIFSSAEGWNLSGRRDVALAHHHGNGALMIGFTDGHVQVVSPARAASQNW